MSLFWLVFGALIVLLVWSLKGWVSKNQIKLSWLSWLGIIVTAIFAFFAVAWATSSIIEGESQAAGMGLLIFGGLSLIIFGLTQRKIAGDIRGMKKKKKKEKKK
ncbi:MAG: dehalogenase [Candidatus Aminicenantales bacterium]